MGPFQAIDSAGLDWATARFTARSIKLIYLILKPLGAQGSLEKTWVYAHGINTLAGKFDRNFRARPF